MSGTVSPFPIRLLDEQKETCLLTTVMLNFTSFQFSFISFLVFFFVVSGTLFLSVLLCSSSENSMHILSAFGYNSSPFMPGMFVLR